MKYKNINLAEEDSYDDDNYAEYETMNYLGEDGDSETAEEEEDAEKKKPKKKRSKKEMAEYAAEGNIYKEAVPVKSQDEMRRYFAELVEMKKNGTPEEQEYAGEMACLHLRGVVYSMIRNQYRNYVERDPSFEDDLVQAAFANIIANLDKYDPEKGVPSTFFYQHINSALSAETNSMKHNIKAPDAALRRKIKRIQKEYSDRGCEATLTDYIVETGEPSSKVKDILAMMQRDMNTHLEAIEQYDQIIQGDDSISEDFENPESLVMKHIVYDEIVDYIKETFTETEAEIFLSYAVDDMGIPEIAKKYGYEDSDDKVRRIIENITHNVKYNARIRQLVAGSVKGVNDDSAVFNILPLEGENDNMDLLEQFL